MRCDVFLSGSLMFLALAACDKAAEGPARDLVPATAEGLQNLFERECIEQRHGAWARQQSERMVRRCLPGDGTCEQNLNDHYSWRIPLTNGETAEVHMTWSVPGEPGGSPDGAITCTLMVADANAPALRQAADRVVARDPTWGAAHRLSLPGLEETFWGPQNDAATGPIIVSGPSIYRDGRSRLEYNASGTYLAE